MPKRSAGILLFRRTRGVEVLLVHPGGPFWAGKDLAAWSIPKGEFDEEIEDGLSAARREFKEELGLDLPDVNFSRLRVVRYASGKHIHCWAGEADLDVASIESNHFEIEWPPKSGRMRSFPEVDRADWFELSVAMEKIHKGLRPVLEQLG
ncbi:MAG TPA: NUDIX domain-containing protein [Rhodothermales bacterium]|nr:NUDIX domain-containing protein [Rhodothermales bacterium]